MTIMGEYNRYHTLQFKQQEYEGIDNRYEIMSPVYLFLDSVSIMTS